MRELLISTREKMSLKQEEVAKMLNTSQQNISLLENGRRNPTLIIAKQLEVFYSIPMEDLFPDIFLNIDTTKCNIEGEKSG